MKFSAALLNSALFASALAGPLVKNLAYAKRQAERQHQSLPISRVEEALLDGRHISYSDNWSGSVITSPPSGSTFTAVTGRFTVPQPSAPSTKAGSYAASAWVGIDGDTYSAAILQAGVDFTATVSSAGKTTYSYDAWYEWYPAVSKSLPLDVSAGDVIEVTVTALTSTTGTAVVENITTGKKATANASARSAASALGGQNAEWIVEDFEQGGSLVDLVDFGTVTFTQCSATTSKGVSEGPSSGGEIDIGTRANPETSVTMSESGLVVKYIG